MHYHKTGNISSSAYRDYEKEGGLSWLGDKSKYPIFRTAKQYGPHTVEFRQRGTRNSYTKVDKNGEIVRGPNGMALSLTPEEIKAKGYPEFDETIVAFVGDKPIGLASNEFGTIGVWIEGAYQKLGIGSDLMVMFMKDNPKFLTGKSKVGQMTIAGENMTAAVYEKLSKEFGPDWFKARRKPKTKEEDD